MDEMLSPRVMDLLGTLERICHDLAWGQPAEVDSLFDLTRQEAYPELIAKLAESFGLMLVKVEAREFRLTEMIRELRQVRDSLEANQARILSESVTIGKGADCPCNSGGIIGQGPTMRCILAQVGRLAETDVNVLVVGETGTGKELIAKALHENSPRKPGPFIAVNCSAIPENLFESEVFGIEKGVATGVGMHRGLAEQARGGTLFLDEIADMPLTGQAKILRLLEERQSVRVGGTRAIDLDVRVVAATNKDLRTEIQAGRFRDDLYFRLNVVQIRLPPLRERREDIAGLFQHFLAKYSRSMGRGELRVEEQVMAALTAYSWPGNVRELENEAKRLAALATSLVISLADLSRHIIVGEPLFGVGMPSSDKELAVMNEAADSASPGLGHLAQGLAQGLPQGLAQAEAVLIERALKATKGNKSRAAALLGITREGLRCKLKRLNMVWSG